MDWFTTTLNNLSTADGTPSTSGSGGNGINPYSLLAGIYDTIEVRSNAAPPVKIAVADLGGQPSPYSQALQPTIIFSGRGGTYTLAPYGVAGEYAGWLSTVGGALALVGAGWLLGRFLK